MNPNEIKDWAQASMAVITAVRAAIGLLPKGPSKDEAQRLLECAESDFKRAEADAAQSLGFEICPRCWPPEILLLGDGEKPKCRACGKSPPPPDPGIYIL